jgi:hypothetical protein
VFFPFGLGARGYEVPAGPDGDRLRRQYKAFLIGVFVLVLACLIALGDIGLFVALAIIVVAYLVWAPYAIRGLKRSDYKLTFREHFTALARAHPAVLLWASTIFWIGMTIFAVAYVWLDPDDWPRTIYPVVFFGLFALGSGYLLMLRRRA